MAPGGVGIKAFWQLLTDGRTATRTISHFDASAYRSRIAAECDFDAAAAGLTSEEVQRMDRAAQFAVVAAREALADSGAATDRVPPHRIGVSIGSAVGATITLEQQYVKVSDRGDNWVVDASNPYPHLYGALVPGTLATEVAWTADAQGPVRVVSTGCTSGLDSVAQGAQFVQDGSADVVLAGATDAPISPITVACFDAIRATSPNNEDPEHASRPFDRNRDGFVLGEGAAVLVLEDEESARRRGARVYCEVAGYAQRSNAFHMTGLRPDGKELAEAVRVALYRARVPANATSISFASYCAQACAVPSRRALKSSLSGHQRPVCGTSSKASKTLASRSARYLRRALLIRRVPGVLPLPQMRNTASQRRKCEKAMNEQLTSMSL
ncbi:beta-ketoacyl-[acyl-carrier-protein] synthase family protein [Streptomyces colonosanans]|uniref:beta-ketoacyl-[acyl-carrier-protein] synthase family protein n=1 Tax=Streptomyces colonosanans TaxID=1428652 RepID=UPI003CCBF562